MPSAYILDLFDAPPRKAREYQPTFWQASFCGIPIPLTEDAERQLRLMHADTQPEALPARPPAGGEGMSERIDEARGVRFVTATYNGETEEYAQCLKCGGEAGWVDCENCADGLTHHNCGEDTCACLHPEDNVECQICDGEGGWYRCVRSCGILADPDSPRTDSGASR